VFDWAIENGNKPHVRIAVCGYADEYDFPEDWTTIPWSAHGGMANGSAGDSSENRHKERIWFSPIALILLRGGQVFWQTLGLTLRMICDKNLYSSRNDIQIIS